MKTAVAVFLLAFVTVVVGGFVFYEFAYDVTEKMKTTFPAQTLQLEAYDVNETCLCVFVRNCAPSAVQVSEAYVNGQTRDLQQAVLVRPSEIGRINLLGSYLVGETYSVGIFSGLGFPLIFDVDTNENRYLARDSPSLYLFVFLAFSFWFLFFLSLLWWRGLFFLFFDFSRQFLDWLWRWRC